MATASLGFRVLDAHVVAGRADETAWHDGTRNLTFAQLVHEVATVAGGLRALGVREGDVVALDLSGPERVLAVLALVRLGARDGDGGSVRLVDGPDGPVASVGTDQVAWAVLRDAGRADPAPALRADVEGYAEAVRARHADLLEPLLRGEAVA
ncbi:MAG: AMP-binding protein [Aeromicrobium erythreum]